MATRHVSLSEAATTLGLPVSGVEALVDAGYLRPKGDGLVSSAEVEAFRARNGGSPSEPVADLLAHLHGVDVGAEEIMATLEASVGEMARRAADVVGGVFAEAASWTTAERERFERQARERFAAILAVTRATDTDEDLLHDLEEAGGAAAFAGAPLPEVLLTLRISRDLLVQEAVSAAEELGQEWGLALAVALTKILPVLDQLTDRIARGYWAAAGLREQEAYARFEHVVEHAGTGIYEVDLDGVVRYANPMMASICGLPADRLIGQDLDMSLPPVDADVGLDIYCRPTESGWRGLQVLRADGVVREVQLQVTARHHEGAVVGFDGVLRDVTAEAALERQKREFFERVSDELRQPVAVLLGLGATLAAHADELPRDRVGLIGRTIHRRSEQLVRLSDDLVDVARLRADELSVSLRPVRLARSAEVARSIVASTDDACVEIDVDPDVEVVADPRRLEQILTHLLENGLRHGAPPVRLDARTSEGWVSIEVRDHGPGVPPALLDDLFDRLHPTADRVRIADRAAGLGLPLVRGLVEAMGGRVRHEDARPGARFVVHLPRTPDGRSPDGPRRDRTG